MQIGPGRVAGQPRKARLQPCPIACDTPLDRSLDSRLYSARATYPIGTNACQLCLFDVRRLLRELRLMADFIRVTDLRGTVRRVNTSAIVQYQPVPDPQWKGAAEMVLQRSGLDGNNSFDVRHTPEAIDKAVEAPGRIVDVEVSPDIPALD